MRGNLYVCGIDYDHCSICIVQTPLPPPQGINDDQSLGANFCYREVKRVSQQLILSLEVEVRTGRPLVPRKNDPREDEREVASCCSIARFFLLSLPSLSPFLSEIEKKNPFLRP